MSLTNNPIPENTLTPLTGAISERVFGAGISGLQTKGMEFALGYQYVDDNKVIVDNSSLLSGEYSNTEFSMGGHWLNLSIRW